jgi:branched-chain amino acid transport system substrate-binding protein
MRIPRKSAAGFRRREFLRGVAAAGAVASTSSLLAACGGLAGSESAGGTGGTTIRIAHITPQTGPLAGFTEPDAYLLDLVRAAYAKGVQVGGTTYQLEIITKDAASDSNRAAEAAREAILQDQVDLILTGVTPTVANPVSDQAEAAGVPCIASLVPWESWFTGRGGDPATGFRYTVCFFTGASGEIQAVPPVWQRLPVTEPTIGALWPNNVDGDTFRAAFTPAIEGIGFRLVDPGPYAEPASDYSAQIGRFRSDGVQILTGVPAPPDFATFWRQCRQNGFVPPYAYVHKAILFPAAVEALGDLGENLMTSAWWTPDLPYTSSLDGMTAKALAEGYQQRSGHQWMQPMGFTYALFEVALAGIKAAADPKDREALAGALRTMQTETIVGPLDFGAGPAPNVAFTPVFPTQWQRGTGPYPYELVIVDNALAPDVAVTGDVKPLPGSGAA